MTRFNVGAEVIVRRLQRGSNERTANVTRVGRKYAYIVMYGSEVAYDAETGYQKSDGYQPASRILTPQMVKDEAERSRLESALKDHGIRVGYGGIRSTVSVRDMQRLLDVLDNPS